MKTTRREFLLNAGRFSMAAAGSFGILGDLQRIAAAATTAEDYRALVCLFLFGGNDSNNMVIPFDAPSYTQYAQGRGRLTLAQNTLLPVTLKNTPGRQFALHPSMAGLQGLINNSKAAIVANVGPLAEPLTRQQYQDGTKKAPPNLFSHSDQQLQWQTSISDQPIRTGWAGRMADLIVAANQANPIATSLSVAGRATLLNGNNLSGFQVSASGRFGYDIYPNDQAVDPLAIAFKNMVALPKGNLFEAAWLDTINRSIETQRVFQNAINNAPPFTTVFPNNSLGDQMRAIARLIAVRKQLNVKRQIFFCSLGGFDTHGEDQLNDQQDLLGAVSASVTALYNATVEMGVADCVTSFTSSDFGRDFPANGNGGSDHGWGSHHLVVGGTVNGGNLFGKFPTLVVGGPDDTSGGRWIPTTSVDEYAATLARWFGVTNTDLATIFPNLGRFANPNVGFML